MKGDKFCDVGVDNSMCCVVFVGYVCLLNKLCLSFDGNFICGFCID